MAYIQITNGQLYVVDGNTTTLATPINSETWIADIRGSGGGGGSGGVGPGSGTFIAPFNKASFTNNNWDGNADWGHRTISTGWHNGIDFAEGSGTPVPCTADGVVVARGNNSGAWSGFGNFIGVDHGPAAGGLYDGQTIYSLYAHFVSAPLFSVGDSVTQGDILGYVGNTGNSFGAHLHWEIHVDRFMVYTNDASGSTVDPVPFIESYGDNWGF